MRRVWIGGFILAVLLGSGIAALISQAALYDNPQGEYCAWVPKEDWTSPDWSDKCSLTMDYYVLVAMAFFAGFTPPMLLVVLWAVARRLDRNWWAKRPPPPAETS